MSKINEQLLIMSNRIIDAVYISSVKLKIGYDAFIEIINHIENIALMDIYKMYGTKPYKKRMFLNPVIDESKPAEDFREYINRVSLSLSDMLTTLEFHRDNLSKVKTEQKTYLKFFEKYKSDLIKITTVILAQQDILMDLLDSIDENEMREKLESYLDNAE